MYVLKNSLKHLNFAITYETERRGDRSHDDGPLQLLRHASAHWQQWSCWRQMAAGADVAARAPWCLDAARCSIFKFEYCIYAVFE
jgi:hypothetical protein